MNYFNSLLLTIGLLLFGGSCFSIAQDSRVESKTVLKTVVSKDSSVLYPCNLQHYNIELTVEHERHIWVKAKEKKELHCEIDMYSNHTGNEIEWSFKSQTLTEESLEKLGLTRFDKMWTSILVIDELDIQNEGEYRCAVANTKKSVKVSVLPDFGFVNVNPREVEVTEGAVVEFHCRIDGIPNLINKKLKWTFISEKGLEVALPNERWKVSNPCIVEKTSFVSTNSSSVKDNGYFVCTAPDGKQSKGKLIVKNHSTVEVVATPQTLTVFRNQYFEFECFSRDQNGKPIGKPEVHFLNGSLVRDDSRFKIYDVGASRIKVKAPKGLNIKESELNLTCEYKNVKAPVTINIQTQCPPNQRSCRDGQCIDSSKMCNGVKDCADGSDEDQSRCFVCDPVQSYCGPFNSSDSTTKQKFNIDWLCDGQKDCENGFDEMNCPKPEETCSPQYFTCNDKTKIPTGNVCDGENDCPGSEDEIGCEKPKVSIKTNSTLQASKGSTVKLVCEATGYPLPKIAWRYNWNCLPETDRITVKEVTNNCENVVSTLTIKNFQYGDDAIYGCEALRAGSRDFAESFFVTIK